MPLTYEWSDRVLLVQHNLTADEYHHQVMHAFQRLLSEAKKQRGGRILSLSISPWILGYPHRIAVLERMLKKILDGGSVWNATGKEIVSVLRRYPVVADGYQAAAFRSSLRGRRLDVTEIPSLHTTSSTARPRQSI